MSSKHKRPVPKLDRRNAAKNINYDFSTSSSPSGGSSHRTRSIDSSLLTDRTSFRVEGIDGEFDLICRSLGLSRPEAFAIPAADWEAHKANSPTPSADTYVHTSTVQNLYSTHELSRNDNDDDDGLCEDCEECSVAGQSGIRGVRPPLLDMLPVVVDKLCLDKVLTQGFDGLVGGLKEVVDDEEDEVSSNAATEVEYFVSPNGPLNLKCDIKY